MPPDPTDAQSKQDERGRRGSNAVIGLAMMGSSITGVTAFLWGLLTAMRGDPAAAGVLLVAAALAFGLLANAVLRR